jgi:hypothetical protein
MSAAVRVSFAAKHSHHSAASNKSLERTAATPKHPQLGHVMGDTEPAECSQSRSASAVGLVGLGSFIVIGPGWLIRDVRRIILHGMKM